MNLEELKDFISDLDNDVAIVINVNVVNVAEPEPEPEPEEDAFWVVVTKDPRLNCRWYEETNAAGKPIMQIYPSDTSNPGERVQFDLGTQLYVKAEKVIADGGVEYYQLTPTPTVDGAEQKLFVRVEDVAII